jgi:hypothetical protein
MPLFARYIGVDYSGAETADSSCKGIRVFMAEGSNEPQQSSRRRVSVSTRKQPLIELIYSK